MSELTTREKQDCIEAMPENEARWKRLSIEERLWNGYLALEKSRNEWRSRYVNSLARNIINILEDDDLIQDLLCDPIAHASLVKLKSILKEL
jgi:ribonuclease D